MKQLSSITRWCIALFVCCIAILQEAQAQPVSISEPGLTPNEIQARRLFNQAYNQVFGPEGSTFSFDVTIAKLFKNKGTLWMKGKKSKSISSRSTTWNNGTTAYVVRSKKKEVDVYHATSPKKDKYSSQFKFEPKNYSYHIETDPEGLLITLKLKKKAKGMKEVKALVDRQTMVPKWLRIKVAFIWATVHISNFRSGNIDDSIFEFPRQQYAGWEIKDKRNKQ